MSLHAASGRSSRVAPKRAGTQEAGHAAVLQESLCSERVTAAVKAKLSGRPAAGLDRR